MGNKRGTLFIGTIVAAISIVLAVGAIIPAVQHDAATASTSLNPLGHVSLVVYDSDGNVYAYRQGDNFVTTDAINKVGQEIFEGDGIGTYNFLALCNGNTATLQTANSCSSELSASTGRVDGNAGAASDSSLMTTSVGNYKRVLSNTFTIAVADAGESVNELAIFDQLAVGGNMFAVATFNEFIAQNGGKVLGTYTVTITG